MKTLKHYSEKNTGTSGLAGELNEKRFVLSETKKIILLQLFMNIMRFERDKV